MTIVSLLSHVPLCRWEEEPVLLHSKANCFVCILEFCSSLWRSCHSLFALPSCHTRGCLFIPSTFFRGPCFHFLFPFTERQQGAFVNETSNPVIGKSDLYCLPKLLFVPIDHCRHYIESVNECRNSVQRCCACCESNGSSERIGRCQCWKERLAVARSVDNWQLCQLSFKTTCVYICISGGCSKAR